MNLSLPATRRGQNTWELHIIRIWSVLDNLTYNALRHTPKGGTILLHLHRRGDRRVLTVADTGEGINAEHLPPYF